MSIDKHCQTNPVSSFILGIGSYLTFPTVHRIIERQSPTTSYQTAENLTGLAALASISYGLMEITTHHDFNHFVATGATLLCTNLLSETYEWVRKKSY